MEVNPIVLILMLHGRGFFGLSVDDAYAVAQKAIKLAGKTADEIDLIDAYDDIWGASLLAGTIVEGGNVPQHPHDWKTRSLNVALAEKDYIAADNIKNMHESEFPKHEEPPKRYKNSDYVAQPKKKINRRPWDKGGE